MGKGRVKRSRGPRIYVCKLQRPVMTNVPDIHVLVYSEDHRIHVQLPLPADDVERIFGDEHKVFAECWLVGTILHIGDVVNDPGW